MITMYCSRQLINVFTKSRPSFYFIRHESQKETPLSNSTVETKPNVETDALYRMIELETRGHDPAVLKSYDWFVNEAAKELNIKIGQSRVPKKLIDRWSLLKSAFVHKKHFAQYETRTHFRILELQYLTGSTADTFIEYIERNLPEGVAMKITKHALERLPEYVKPSK